MLFFVWFLIVVLLLWFVYFFPHFYVCEIIISFLPYIVFFSLVILWIFVVLFIKCKKKSRFCYLFWAFLYLIIFFLYAFKFNNFYTWEWFNSSQNISNGTWISVLYSNIWYKVKNYDRLLDWIWKYNADVILMVEFTEDFDDAMGEKLKQEYPYTAHMSFADKYYGNVIFSKYPVKNLSDEIEVENSKWRYSYFLVDNWIENYYIYLVHTAAPVSLDHYKMRNNQLHQLLDDFSIHQQNRNGNDRVMIIWDFNLSPRSYYYKNLEKNLLWVNDLTKRFTVLTTRSYKKSQIIASHIDHVFVDNNSKIDDLHVMNTNGSDHRWIFIKNFR